jgi:predicted alpha/beta superfamily hydrolase
MPLYNKQCYITLVVVQILIIGINNTPNRTYELTYSVDPTVGTGGGLDFYLDFIEQTLIPLVEVGYRITGTGRWGILGSSLGGLASCYAGWTRPDLYWMAGCMSSSFWWNNEDFNNTILPQRNSGGWVVVCRQL